MTKKTISLLIALVMSLSLCIPAFAEEAERVMIAVESESDIIDFRHSAEYDPDIDYSFIIENDIQARILCPKCQNNSYRGITEHREMDIIPRPCPTPDLVGDLCTEYHVYAYSACDSCGYKTSANFLNKYWIVECHAEQPSNWATYIARPGQSYRDGYDLHEDPVYMGLM